MKMGVAGIGRRRETWFARVGIGRHAVGHQTRPVKYSTERYFSELGVSLRLCLGHAFASSREGCEPITPFA